MVPDSALARMLVRAVALGVAIITPVSFLFQFLYVVALFFQQQQSSNRVASLGNRILGNELVSGVSVWISLARQHFTSSLGLEDERFRTLCLMAMNMLAIWSFLELCFFAHHKMTRSTLSKTPVSECAYKENRHDRIRLFDRIIKDLADGKSAKSWVSGWFMDSKYYQLPETRVDEVRRENLREWMAWAFYTKEMHQVNAEETADLDVMLARVEGQLGISLNHGKNPKIRSIRLNFDKVPIHHRPLFVYAFIYCLDRIKSGVLRFVGFSRPCQRGRKATNLTYYHYRPKNCTTNQPLVFIHGLGVGLFPYCRFVYKIVCSNPHRPVVLIELPFVAMKFWKYVPTIQETCDEIEYVVSTVLGYKEASWVGHSLGTI